MSTNDVPRPLVATSTTASSQNFQTVHRQIERKLLIIPDYQRDSDQWDETKKSLLIESVLNNLTIPAFFVCPEKNDGIERNEVVDGQQRLSVLEDFYLGRFQLVPHDEAEYLSDRAIHYAGKSYSELPKNFQDVFLDYLLTLIRLPEGLDRSTKLEIFRRINEGGTPLSAQDLRLAYYGDCPTVNFIRLVGIYDPTRERCASMIASAKERFGSDWPWKNKQAIDEWKFWWAEKQTAVGQTASEMFLWFLIAIYYNQTDRILADTKHLAQNLRTTFSGRTDEVADIFCAQLDKESSNAHPNQLPTLASLQTEIFPFFENAFLQLKSNIPNISVDKYRRAAFVIAGLFTANAKLEVLSPENWNGIRRFLAKPREYCTGIGIEFPEAKGRWSGAKGQKAQIQAVHNIVGTVLA